MRFRSTLVVLALLCASACAAEAEAKGQAIGVATTWNELAKQPSIELRKNATARFGVQSLRAPRFSGIMIYCMTEAYDPDDDEDDNSGNRLGPFHIQINDPDPQHNPAVLKQQHEKRDYGRLVFGQIIPLLEIGTYSVELRDKKDAVVASVKIECVDELFHAWTTLVPSGDDTPPDTELESDPETTIETAAGAPSVPKIDGGTPILYWLSGGARGPRKFSEDEPLPTLPNIPRKALGPLTDAQKTQAVEWISLLSSSEFSVREKASNALLEMGDSARELLFGETKKTSDAETLFRLRSIVAQYDGPFQIRLEGKTVRLKTPLPFPSTDFEHYFLARWWVNGKPVEPDDDVDIQEDPSANGDAESHSARMKLTFSLAALKAKTGDTIGLQLLFCPDGMRAAQDEHYESIHHAPLSEHENDAAEVDFPNRFPVASNTIEFKAP